ncbi:hypothetical protein [Jiangella asiatica]|uniref:Uncharacterized protein n=1 Tax=Jiangella asiatica TaxID=2530372 RepID=A0A4R5CL92_9ACTN|nr:hypothetical protein [Jiangella asiatica]TDD99979.1 hypothetical protein E1269_26925 [Jiangella asiatica]
MADVERFRALARSSPWLWTSVRLTRRMVGDARIPTGTVRAWVDRPGRTRVEDENGRVSVYDESSRERTDRGVFAATSDGSPLPGEVMKPRYHFPQDPEAPSPRRRPDGLVAARPTDFSVIYDDPMHVNYLWVAMLDPVELADGAPPEGPPSPEVPALDVLALTGGTRAGRPTVDATVRPASSYSPRCTCCALLDGEVVAGLLRQEGGFVPPRQAYADAFEVALDTETGICVRMRELGGDHGGTGFDVVIETVTPA